MNNDIDIKSLEHWRKLGIIIEESMDSLVLSQTYDEWLLEYPDGMLPILNK